MPTISITLANDEFTNIRIINMKNNQKSLFNYFSNISNISPILEKQLNSESK